MKRDPGKGKFGGKARRHGKESKMRSERSIKEAAQKSGSVKVYFDPSVKRRTT